MTSLIKRKPYRMTPAVKVIVGRMKELEAADAYAATILKVTAAMLKKLDKQVVGLTFDVAYLTSQLKKRDWRKCGPIARTPK